MPERFELEYIDADGSKKRPVVIHRAILGSLDRFTAFVLEETKGALPVWLSPVQVKIVTVSEKNISHATDVQKRLQERGFRVELDTANESISKKIRFATKDKIPYVLVIGDRECAELTVSVRERGSDNTYSTSLDSLITNIHYKCKNKELV